MQKTTIAAAVLLCLITAGCTNEDKARHALEGAGYTRIEMQGYSLFGCGKDDQFSDEFSALGPTGKPVSGVVCSGWFKGATIRQN